MVKSVDTRDLKSLGESCAGSNPAERTKDMYDILADKYKVDRNLTKHICLMLCYAHGLSTDDVLLVAEKCIKEYKNQIGSVV